MTDSVDRQAPPSRAVREAALETLSWAYGDGQISLEEYDERVAGVQAADNAWRLERWVDDLQPPPPAPPTWRDRWAGATAPVRQDWARYSRRRKLAVAGATLAVTASLVGVVTYDVVRDEPAAVVEQGLSTGLGDFREAYEAELGTTFVGRVQIDRGYTRLEQPVESDPPRVQAWAWQDGSFTRVGQVRGGDPGVVDLAEVDVDAVERALAQGAAELGVEDPSVVTTLVTPESPTSEARITLVIRNEFKETARMTVDLAGQELTRQPFSEPGEG